jgi:hypothetical protein
MAVCEAACVEVVRMKVAFAIAGIRASLARVGVHR